MDSNDREKVELYVSCRQLKDLDFIGKSDPQVKCYMNRNETWELVGQTEVIEDSLDPTFSTTFVMDLIFEVKQPLIFEVADVDKSGKSELIGTVQTTLGSIMGARGQTSVYDLKSKEKTTGKLIVQGEKVNQGGNMINWQWKALNLINTDGYGSKSDPFLRFVKHRAIDVLKVYDTEVIKNELNPVWKPFGIVDTKLCKDHNTPFTIECWDWEKGGKFQFIGSCQVTLNTLKSGSTQFELTNPKKNGPIGTLKLLQFSIQESSPCSFIDYIRGGTQLNAVVAIDFTASNGDPTTPESLHAKKPDGQLNEYQKAINAVCQIILSYDYDQLIPVYGFGGKPRYPTMSLDKASHCFPCSGSSEQHQVGGLQGVMDVYSYALQNIYLSGPTFFAPLLSEAMKVCQINKQDGDEIYTILLILTDGEIHDMDQTIDLIIEASRLPLSIIIIGLGDADFTNMEILDGDKGLTDSKGQKAIRDLVQFVPFKDFKGDMQLLAQRVLAEVPDQLVQYMTLAGKKPKAPQVVDVNQAVASKAYNQPSQNIDGNAMDILKALKLNK